MWLARQREVEFDRNLWVKGNFFFFSDKFKGGVAVTNFGSDDV